MEKELLYKSAEKSLANKDYFKAAEELSKLYVEYGEKNFRINYLLFISFKNLNEHERAVETAEECLENYIRDNCKFSQYLSEKILSGRDDSGTAAEKTAGTLYERTRTKVFFTRDFRSI